MSEKTPASCERTSEKLTSGIVAVSISAFAALSLGMVFLYLLARRPRTMMETSPETLVLAPPPSQKQIAGMTSSRTYYLQSATDKKPVLVAAAPGDYAVDVVLQCVGPAGAYALVSSDFTNVKQVKLPMPVGDVLTIPLGNPQRMRLQPNERLYAAGSVNATLLSVSVAATRE